MSPDYTRTRWQRLLESGIFWPPYWISTADAEGTPLARPIDGVWLDGALYFGGHEDSRWQCNLRANPRVCLTLEDARNALILEGVVEHFVPDEALALGNLAKEKYEWGELATTARKPPHASSRQ